MEITQNTVTTGLEIPGHRMSKNLGLVRGIVVRSRNIFGTIGGGLQSLLGGNITLYETMCERAREQAYERLIEHAAALGANAVVGLRYDATELMSGMTEVIAYGTAVVVE